MELTVASESNKLAFCLFHLTIKKYFDSIPSFLCVCVCVCVCVCAFVCVLLGMEPRFSQIPRPFPSFLVCFLFFFWVGIKFELRASSCKAGTLPLSKILQSVLLPLFRT
jgi:hypothetical protein